MFHYSCRKSSCSPFISIENIEEILNIGKWIITIKIKARKTMTNCTFDKTNTPKKSQQSKQQKDNNKMPLIYKYGSTHVHLICKQFQFNTGTVLGYLFQLENIGKCRIFERKKLWHNWNEISWTFQCWFCFNIWGIIQYLNKNCFN